MTQKAQMLTMVLLGFRCPLSIARRLTCLLGLTLGACAYEGAIDAPLTQKFTWFSYVNGDDIREGCGEGSAERYRIVYNARYDEQLRSYEILGDQFDGGGFLTARAQGRASISEIVSSDIMAPWRWKKSQVRLEAQEMQDFRQDLADSGFFEPPPVGLELNSKAFYWTAVGCVNGRIVVNAWQHPSKRFDSLRFPETLLAHDQTDLPFIPPRRLYPVDLGSSSGPTKEFSGDTPRFLLRVEKDGFSGAGPRLRNPF